MATNVGKIDSNVTGTRFAEETSPGVLPESPVWYPAEPNSYGDFGGQISTVARNPINPGRQRKKGVVTDKEGAAGWNQDLTQTNLHQLIQGFMMADYRRKPEVLAREASVKSVVDASPDYYLLNNLEASGAPVVANGGTGYTVGDVLTVSGGTAVTATTLRVLTAPAGVIGSVEIVEPGLYSVAPSNDVSVTGGSGSGAEFTLAYTNLVTFLANSLVMASNFGTAANNGLKKVTGFSTNGTHVEVSDTLVGEGSAPATADLITVGYQFATGTLDVTTSGGAYPKLTRASGAFDFTTLGLIPGELVFIGGDAAGEKFTNSANNGFARVKSVAATYIELDKTSATMVNETGTGKTIQLFTGRVIKNEQGTLIKRRTYQIERTLGVPDTDNPTQEQAEYELGSCPNQLQLNTPRASKVTMDLSFISIDSETRTGAEGLKSGSRPSIVESDAFNTSSDISRVKLSQVVPNDSYPSPLFSYMEEMTITVNNNVSLDKAVGVIGAFDTTLGDFEVGGNIKAYFADILAIRAVEENVDITLDACWVKANAGIAIDMPLITLGDARPDVQKDTAIMEPLQMLAATGAKVDSNMNHTLLVVFFDYLPDLAE